MHYVLGARNAPVNETDFEFPFPCGGVSLIGGENGDDGGIDGGDWSGPGSSSTSLLLSYSTSLPEFSIISPAPFTPPHL